MIKFYDNRKIFFSISIAIFIIGIICACVFKVNFDIQFTGGSILKYTYAGELDTDKVDSVISAAISRDCSAQTTFDAGTNEKKVSLNLGGKEGLSPEEQQILIDTLTIQFPDNDIKLSESSVVEPFIGRRFLSNAIISIILAFIMIVLYVGWSFRKIGGISAGVMAIVALVHDVIIVFMTFVIFRIPINEQFIAVALSIIGFSVNDTIVIYDRIRENTLLYGRKMPIEELVDKSINQSITRSLNTSLAVFLSVLVVYIFTEIYGIASMRSFSLPMMLGTISGCYSTICIAGPLWVMWKKYKQKASAR